MTLALLTREPGADQRRAGIDGPARAAFIALLSTTGAAPATQLLRTARMRTAWPGELLIREEQTDRPGVLLEGMLRSVVSLPDGRMATIHYPRAVQFFGLATLFASVPLSVHVIRKATVIELDANELRRSAHDFPDLGAFLSRHLALAFGQVPSIIEEFGFKTVSQRVASHIMRLSEPEGLTGARTAHVTQTALAEYVGSAREVVARSLRSLADQGAVQLGRGSIRITDEAELRRNAS
jgi:CRP/FNR family cyclic AMP-dependent transcriptional regulator